MNVKTEVVAANADATFAEINITPFTDVLLVLLVIFMVLAALVGPAGFEKEFPNKCVPACALHSRQMLQPLDVTISHSGAIRVGGATVDARQLYGALARYARATHGELRITADAKAPYGAIIRVLDAAKEARLEPVTLVTS